MEKTRTLTNSSLDVQSVLKEPEVDLTDTEIVALLKDDFRGTPNPDGPGDGGKRDTEIIMAASTPP